MLITILFQDVQVYKYYRDLINFKQRGDPMMMLKCINPQEAKMLDAACGIHIKFRLAGACFTIISTYNIAIALFSKKIFAIVVLCKFTFYVICRIDSLQIYIIRYILIGQFKTYAPIAQKITQDQMQSERWPGMYIIKETEYQHTV